MEFFTKIFDGIASLSAKLPSIGVKPFFICALVFIVAVGLIVGFTYFGSHSYKLKSACKKVIKYLALVDDINDDNVGDFTERCFSASAPMMLRDTWVQYLGVRFGYPSDIVSEQEVLDKEVKKHTNVRANVFAGISLIVLAVFAFWGYGSLSGAEMSVIHCAGLLLIGAIYLALVLIGRAQYKKTRDIFYVMQEDLDAKVDFQIEKNYATDASPLIELASIADGIIARNTAKLIELTEQVDNFETSSDTYIGDESGEVEPTDGVEKIGDNEVEQLSFDSIIAAKELADNDAEVTADSEVETTDSEIETENEVEVTADSETETETEIEVEPTADSETENESEAEIEVEPTADTETENEVVETTDSETENESEIETEVETSNVDEVENVVVSDFAVDDVVAKDVKTEIADDVVAKEGTDGADYDIIETEIAENVDEAENNVDESAVEENEINVDEVDVENAESENNVDEVDVENAESENNVDEVDVENAENEINVDEVDVDENSVDENSVDEAETKDEMALDEYAKSVRSGDDFFQSASEDATAAQQANVDAVGNEICVTDVANGDEIDENKDGNDMFGRKKVVAPVSEPTLVDNGPYIDSEIIDENYFESEIIVDDAAETAVDTSVNEQVEAQPIADEQVEAVEVAEPVVEEEPIVEAVEEELAIAEDSLEQPIVAEEADTAEEADAEQPIVADEEAVEEAVEDIVEETSAEQVAEDVAAEAVPEEAEEIVEIVENIDDEEDVEAPKLAKLPLLLDYILSQPLTKSMKIKVATLILTAYNGFKGNPKEKAIVIQCMAKIMLALR